MTNQELINSLYNKTLEIYQEEGLKSLRGSIDHEYFLNGRNILKWYSDVSKKLNQKFDHFENLDSLLFISDEIKYFTAQLYLYRPFLDNPLENRSRYNNKVIYHYRKSLPDRRYFMFSEIIFEKLYAFWGQLAKLLAASLNKKINDHQIFFANILLKIPNQDSENFLWLDNFLKTEYNKINLYRKQIVHHRGLETRFTAAHTKFSTNLEEIEKLIHERDRLPEYFKINIDFTLTGFEKTLALISENK
jgi:hypothetical protein